MGAPKEAIALDDWTVRFEFKEPRPWAEEFGNQAAYWGLHPKHYLQKWHIDYNPDAEKVAAEEGYEKWEDAFYHHYRWSPKEDIDKPVLQPWVITQMTSALKVLDRNPYYFVVDEEGNQLPYIDRVHSQVVDTEVYNLKIVTGEADVAFVGTTFENMSLYKQNEEAGGYAVTLLESVSPMDATFLPNFTAEVPIKRELIQNDNFRKALSIAIDRDEINEVVYFGNAVPMQATLGIQQPYYDPDWAKSWAQYDPDLANRMLDEIGLAKRGSDGFRLDPDGKSMVFTIGYNAGGSEAQYDFEEAAIVLTEKAVDFIKGCRNRLFFLLFAERNIHAPIRPNPRFLGTSGCGVYGDFIHELDWSVGEILDTLDRLDLTERTLVIFTSDNGGVSEGQDSFNILPAILGRQTERPLRRSLIHDSWKGLYAIREGPWKLIAGPGGGGIGWKRRANRYGSALQSGTGPCRKNQLISPPSGYR